MRVSLLRRHRQAVILAVLAAGIAAFLLLMMAGGSLPSTAQAAASHAKHAKHATRHHARHASATTDPATDPDNVQSGDQTTPDPSGAASTDPAGETGGTSESTVDPEAGQPGEPANGWQDAPGAPGVDCTGNCVQ
jgi:hypothetical protein